MTAGSSFDAKAREWDRNPRIHETAGAFIREIREHVPLSGGMELLELGCGTGVVSMSLHDAVHRVTLVDSSRGMIEVLEGKIRQAGIRNMAPRCGDLATIDLDPWGFDLAYTLMALHHVPDVAGTLVRLARLLRPEGTLCVGDLEPEDGSFHSGDPELHRGFEASWMRRTVEAAGFRVVHLHRMHVLKKPVAGGEVRDFPLFFLAARRRHGP